MDHQDLSSNVGSFGRSEETNRGSHFLRRAGAAERCMKPATFSDFVDDAVAIQPGATPLIVIPSPAVSMAKPRIIPSMAAFAAPYAASPGLLESGPVTDVTFTIRPYFCCVIPG